MNAVSTSTDVATISKVIERFAGERIDARGIDTYVWIVDILRSATDASDTALACGEAAGVLTTANGAAVLHSLIGESDEERGEIIAYAKSLKSNLKLRGLALPGDRRTKNLFEEARMPAQVLVH